MLLKIHLLHVMSIGLVTVPIKAQEPSLVEVPELYMEESDKALLNSIWNLAGFPVDQNELKPEVSRKFKPMLRDVGLGILRNVIPHLGKIPYFPENMKPVLPLLASFVPDRRRMTDLTEIKQITNNNLQQTESPITTNNKVLRKPSNPELDSSEEDDSPELISNKRALHLENLEISDDNNKETNAKYYPSENLKTSPQDLETVNLAMEQMQRMLQFQGVDDNIHNNKKSRNFLPRKTYQNMNGGEQSHDTTTEADIPSKSHMNHSPLDVTNFRPYHEKVDLKKKNSHIDYMYKKEYKTRNTARNSETSSHHPIRVSHKCAGHWKESSKRSVKSPKTSKYYEMLENNQMIHNVEGYNPMMHQYPNEPQVYLFQQLRDVRSANVDATQLPFKQNKITK